jgi:hypothetical protein
MRLARVLVVLFGLVATVAGASSFLADAPVVAQIADPSIVPVPVTKLIDLGISFLGMAAAALVVMRSGKNNATMILESLLRIEQSLGIAPPSSPPRARFRNDKTPVPGAE